MTKPHKIALIVVLGVIAGFMLSEALVRILWTFQIVRMDNLGVISYDFMRETSDPDLPHELKTNLNLITDEYHIVTNKDGFRDRNFTVEKPEDVTRILVIGDSITFGYGIKENRDIYYKILEEMLNKPVGSELPHRRFEVIGIAAPGYNTYTELSILKKKGLKYSPDIVIFAYCLNDMRDAVYSCSYAKGLRLGNTNEGILKLPPFIKRNLRRSVLFLYLANKANSIRSSIEAKKQLAIMKKEEDPQNNSSTSSTLSGSSPITNGPKLYFPEGSLWYNIYKDSHKGKNLEVMDKYILSDLENISKTYHFKVVFVIFPAFEKNQLYYPASNHYVFGEAHSTLKNLFEKHNFLVLDLKDSLGGKYFEEVAMDDCHLSPNGHHIAAKAIYDYLNKKSII